MERERDQQGESQTTIQVSGFISSRSQNKLRKELTVEEYQSVKKRFDFYLSCCAFLLKLV
jgi:hypothetical protein